MIPSIRGRLVAALAVAIAVVVTASAFFVHARFRARLYDHLEEELALEAREMLEVAQHDASLLGAGGRPGVLAEFEKVESSCYYEFLAPDGTVVMSSGNLRGGSIARPAQLADPEAGFATTLPDGRPGHGIRVAIDAPEWQAFTTSHPEFQPASGADFGGASIVVATAPADQEAILGDLRVSLALAALATIAVATAVVGFVVRRALLPLERLSTRAASIQPGNLSTRFGNERAPRELQPIHRRLDELLDRVQGAFERERRFNSAVAHELRTPVAELKTICELDLRWPDGEHEHAATVKQAGEIAAQMESLIGRLLALRRAEAGGSALEVQEVDVAELVTREFARVEPRTADRRLELKLPPHAPLRADPTLLTAIVSNLVSNAVDHSPAGGAIGCTLDASAGLRLDVTNPAPDLSDEDVSRLFEPFWRKDASRTDQQHWGLGLALARAFAEQLNLRLSATLDHDRTLRVRLETAPVA